MGILSRLWKRSETAAPTPFEAFLKAFADDPHLADRMIRDTKPSNRLMMVFCLGCFHCGYTLTAQLHRVLTDSSVVGSSRSQRFPFDAIAQEAIALAFYTVMAENMADDDDDDSDSIEDNTNEKFEALKEARHLADTLAEKYIERRQTNMFRSRLMAYSLANYRRKSVFEQATNYVLTAFNSETDGAASQVHDIARFSAIQSVLTSDVLPALQTGIDALYAEWKANPNAFGS